MLLDWLPDTDLQTLHLTIIKHFSYTARMSRRHLLGRYRETYSRASKFEQRAMMFVSFWIMSSLEASRTVFNSGCRQ